MSEMVERVARAIWEAECNPVVDGDVQGWQHMVARAAIEAMREPTSDMLGSVYGASPQQRGPTGLKERLELSDSVATEMWQAMIDEALK